MMLTALLLAMAQVGVAAPAPVTPHTDAADPDQLLDPEDYPQFALVRDLAAAVPVELFVSPQGHAMECSTAKGWGDGQLADAMCDILQHKHLPPAHLADGSPAYSVVRGLARLFIPGTKQGDEILRLAPITDVELEAAHLPGGAAHTQVNLLLTITPAGTVGACVPTRDERQVDLAGMICPALRTIKPGQRVGIDGAGVTYVLTLRAGLNAKDAPPAEPDTPVLPN